MCTQDLGQHGVHERHHLVVTTVTPAVAQVVDNMRVVRAVAGMVGVQDIQGDLWRGVDGTQCKLFAAVQCIALRFYFQTHCTKRVCVIQHNHSCTHTVRQRCHDPEVAEDPGAGAGAAAA